MNEKHRFALTRCRPFLMQFLSVNDIIDRMRYNDNFTCNDAESITSQTTEVGQARKFLDILEGKPQSTFEFFLEKLKEVKPESYEDVKEEYEKELSRPTQDLLPDVSKALRAARVPLPPNFYVHRKKLIDDTRAELTKLAGSKEGRLLITGMGGQGKTVLTAESLRSPDIVQLFPGGMSWVTVGKEADPIEICRNIAKSLKCLDPNSTNLVQVQQDIINWTAENPLALVILDDVWQKSTAEAFNCLTHAVITSRTLDVMDHFRGDTFKVQIVSGFSQDETMNLLVPANAIEEDKAIAQDLHDKCNGWPFLICIIGAHLRKMPSHLEYYSKLVLDGKLDNIKTVGTDYNYKNAAEVIAVSYDDLEKPLQAIMEYFAIFDSHEYISVQVMNVLLDGSVEELESRLETLTEKSLVTKRMSADELQYGVHDILHQFLSGFVKTNELSRTALERYQNHCSSYGQWWSFQIQDKTIWWYLIKFMREAELDDMIVNFFTDLRSLEVAIKYTNHYHILCEYECIKVCFENRNKTRIWEAFHSFFQRNAEAIIRLVSHPENTSRNRKEFKDLVQFALFFEPQTSPVYQAARKLAGDKLYWTISSPQTRAASSSEILWQITGVLDSDLSPDGKMIAICKRGGDIAIHELGRGEQLLLIKAPKGQYHVRFDRKSQRIVSAGLFTRTITVWILPPNLHKQARKNRRDRTQVLTSHNWKVRLDLGDEVLIAAVSFSHDNTDVLVVSDDGFLRRCSLLSEQSIMISPLQHGVVKFRGATISDDDTILAIVHKDCYLVVYDAVEERELAAHSDLADVELCALFPCAGEEERLVLGGGNTILIWNYVQNRQIQKFHLEGKVSRVTVSKCKRFLAVATKSHKVHLYSLETLCELHTISLNDTGHVLHMEMICNDHEGKCCSSAFEHKLLTEADRLSMRILQSDNVPDEGARPLFKPRNCWTLGSGRSVILWVRIMYVGEQFQEESLPGFSESINRRDASRRCCLNSEGSRLAVAIKNAVHSYSVNWSNENFVSEIDPENKQETMHDIILIKLIEEQEERLLIIDCQGSIKIQYGSHSHKLRDIGNIETKELVDVLYLQKRRSLLIHYKKKVCLLPLKNTVFKLSEEKVVFTANWRIGSVSINSGERYVAVAYGHAFYDVCVVTDLDSSERVRIDLADALAFHPLTPNILCVGWGSVIRFYLIDNQEALKETAIGEMKVELDWIRRLSWSPDGQYLAVRGEYDGLHLLSVQLSTGLEPTVQMEMLWTIRGWFYSDDFDLPFSISNDAVIAADKFQNAHVVSKCRAEIEYSHLL